MLTPKGREVLRGDEDRVRLIGIDRWLGAFTSSRKLCGAGTGPRKP